MLSLCIPVARSQAGPVEGEHEVGERLSGEVGEGRAAVIAHAATKTKHSYETFYDGWGGGWRWRMGGFGSSTTYVQDYKVGTVVVDIFDADTKQAIWRGSATDALSDNQKDNAQATEAAITNALLAAETTTGANDLRIYALPVDRMLAVMKKYGRLP